ncbi:MerR family transcriptional regulator [Alteromonas alba]|uniref:MerR family transcriptional regulator n=1 Tax=Alteromonas alba TaxID=2079529 RepID=A0A2S9V8F2_9ALTE|nr:MerR family DNA-binding protein [Alteromonas alba]PRO72746.1 MerR family transcriptional regulator [Alteromonas alba]
MPKSSRTIGVLARELNLNVETIRFYERKGLTAQPDKPANGFRVYPDSVLKQLKFITKAKTLGFTLDEIRSLLTLTDMPCGEMANLAEKKLSLVDKKIAALARLKTGLQDAVNQCGVLGIFPSKKT